MTSVAMPTQSPLACSNDAQRWAAVQRRDPAADGVFYFSVATTGVYCRPSCPARRAHRKNFAFHATREDAEAAGFRPCKRCRPGETSAAERHVEAVARACRFIEAADEPPSLNRLAQAVGLSRYHFHRVFKAATGVTPKAYAEAHRARRMRDELTQADTVTDAIYSAGYASGGRFYADSKQRLGMTPTNYRAGGKGTAIRFAVGECSLGSILVATTDNGICAIEFGNDPDQLARAFQDRFGQAHLIGGDTDFENLVSRVVALVESPRQDVDLPLDVRGTAFQQRVWQALRAIPGGSTASYTEIAERIGRPKAARAVAAACAANPLAVAIPCHRVVRTDGSLSGYRWGVERKRNLLKREATA